jgi:hypothetical protein
LPWLSKSVRSLMTRLKSVKSEIGSWPQVIEFTEEKLRLARRKASELEQMVTMFRELEAAGQPSPADLATGRTATKRQKQA